ncbi:MAG: hypothetical protein CM15mP49_03380 [Actinomycetota bacterium]|nr:MAG: hypothetical protein CM15mP49_03380 [Actinomycetota bacterium]
MTVVLAVSHFVESPRRSWGPDGGDGGNGGDIWLVADHNVASLLAFRDYLIERRRVVSTVAGSVGTVQMEVPN